MGNNKNILYKETEHGTIIQRGNFNTEDLDIIVILVIAGNPNEFEEYKKFHLSSIRNNDILIYINNRYTVVGIQADYIKIVGTGNKRIDFEEVKNACIRSLK